MLGGLRRMFNGERLENPARKSGPAIPNDLCIYAIGDVHGCLDLLNVLLDQISDDARRNGALKTRLIMLGDLIDRGPHSAQVVERLTHDIDGIDELVLICGNHEEALLRLLDGDPSELKSWLQYGGFETLQSYGIGEDVIDAGRNAVMTALAQNVPTSHIRIYRSMIDFHVAGDYAFVHAGVAPGKPLARQSPHDLRWIRGPFLTSEKCHEYVIVHGHTISTAIEDQGNRIGLDTGAYRSGVLSALALQGNEKRFLQTGPAT